MLYALSHPFSVRPFPLPVLLALAAPLAFTACTGTIGDAAPNDAVPEPGATAGTVGDTPGAPPAVSPPATCDPRLKPATPARLRRLTTAQYDNSARALLAPRKVPAGTTNPFDDALAAARFSTMAQGAGIPQQTLTLLLDAAERLADELAPALREGQACLAAATLERGCLETAFGTLGAAAFRRPLTADELGRFVGLVLAEQAAAGADTALRLGLSAMLSSPRFAFVWEIGAGAPDEHGRTKLGPYEVAATLSYAITEGPPDAALVEAARKGELATAAQLRAHAERLLLTSGADLASVRRFFGEYFGYPKAPDIFKDPKTYPFHNGTAIVDDTELFVRDAVSARKGVLQTLLTSSKGFARADSAKSYGLDVPSKTPVAVTFPSAERAGILTHPSFLVALSHNEGNDVIKRGRFVNESLLCRKLPDLALPEVPSPPDLPNATLRERLKIHSEKPECAGCHSLMDPPGLSFEQYDHTGRYRTTEVGKPVDASGVLSGAGSEDGPFRNAVDMSARLARSPVVEDCFARHAMRYWLGRLEAEADGCTLAAARTAYQKSEGDVLQMFIELLASESFLYRTSASK
jgi:hypothetical protein